jgi:hypothetical protein
MRRALLENQVIRGAMAAAAAGTTIVEAVAAVTELSDRNCFFVNILSSASLRKWLALRPGLFPEGFTVQDGQCFAFGLAPTIREGTPLNDGQKAKAMMGMRGSSLSLEEEQAAELQRIKSTLAAGHALASVVIACVGRPDYGHTFAAQMKDAGIPLYDEPTVHVGGMLYCAIASWGELFVSYTVVDAETGKCPPYSTTEPVVEQAN